MFPLLSGRGNFVLWGSFRVQFVISNDIILFVSSFGGRVSAVIITEVISYYILQNVNTSLKGTKMRDILKLSIIANINLTLLKVIFITR